MPTYTPYKESEVRAHDRTRKDVSRHVMSFTQDQREFLESSPLHTSASADYGAVKLAHSFARTNRTGESIKYWVIWEQPDIPITILPETIENPNPNLVPLQSKGKVIKNPKHWVKIHEDFGPFTIKQHVFPFGYKDSLPDLSKPFGVLVHPMTRLEWRATHPVTGERLDTPELWMITPDYVETEAYVRGYQADYNDHFHQQISEHEANMKLLTYELTTPFRELPNGDFVQNGFDPSVLRYKNVLACRKVSQTRHQLPKFKSYLQVMEDIRLERERVAAEEAAEAERLADMLAKDPKLRAKYNKELLDELEAVQISKVARPEDEIPDRIEMPKAVRINLGPGRLPTRKKGRVAKKPVTPDKPVEKPITVADMVAAMKDAAPVVIPGVERPDISGWIAKIPYLSKMSRDVRTFYNPVTHKVTVEGVLGGYALLNPDMTTDQLPDRIVEHQRNELRLRNVIREKLRDNPGYLSLMLIDYHDSPVPLTPAEYAAVMKRREERLRHRIPQIDPRHDNAGRSVVVGRVSTPEAIHKATWIDVRGMKLVGKKQLDYDGSEVAYWLHPNIPVSAHPSNSIQVGKVYHDPIQGIDHVPEGVWLATFLPVKDQHRLVGKWYEFPEGVKIGWLAGWISTQDPATFADTGYVAPDGYDGELLRLETHPVTGRKFRKRKLAIRITPKPSIVRGVFASDSIDF